MTIPADNARAAETSITDEEWAQAETAHERLKALVETKPRAKERFDAVQSARRNDSGGWSRS